MRPPIIPWNWTWVPTRALLSSPTLLPLSVSSDIQLSYIKLDRIARDPSPVDSSHTLLHSVLILNTLASAATFERDERERVAKAQDAWYHSVLSGLDMDEVSEMDAIEEEEEEEPSSSQPPPQSRRVSTVEVVEVSDDEEDEDQDMAGSGSSSPATSPSFITFALPVPSAPASLTTLISSTSFTITSPVPRTSPVASGTSISVQFAEDELSDDEDDDPELVTPPSNVLDAFEDDDECDFDGEDDDGMDVFGPDEGRSLSGLQLFSPSASTPTR